MSETTPAGGTAVDTREMYIELLKRALMHTLYSGSDAGLGAGRNQITRALQRFAARRKLLLVRQVDDPDRERTEGRDWPLFGQTMIGERRLDNVRRCVEDVIARDVPGNLIETGVWRGGATILMRGVLAAHGVADRTVYVADSFEGLPAPDREQDVGGPLYHLADRLSISLEEVQDAFRRYDLLDDQVRFVKGWFKDTLHTIEDQQWSVIRLDGDMYGSTMDAIAALYPSLSPGGYLIVDDYLAIPECRKAIDDYRSEHGITEPIQEIDWNGVYWQRAE